MKTKIKTPIENPRDFRNTPKLFYDLQQTSIKSSVILGFKKSLTRVKVMLRRIPLKVDLCGLIELIPILIRVINNEILKLSLEQA